MQTLEGNMTTTVTVDVREDLSSGREPLSKILAAVKTLASGQCLKLVTPFEPLPLFSMLKRMGFQHQSKRVKTDHWETIFTPQLEAKSDQSLVPEKSQSAPPDVQGIIRDVDARGLEPPQPMVKILTALESLKPGEIIRAHTDRRPMHLLDALDGRGFRYTSEEQGDGSWITQIHDSFR